VPGFRIASVSRQRSPQKLYDLGPSRDDGSLTKVVMEADHGLSMSGRVRRRNAFCSEMVKGTLRVTVPGRKQRSVDNDRLWYLEALPQGKNG